MSWFLDFLMLILIDENHSLSGYGYTNRTMHTRVALAMHTTVLCILLELVGWLIGLRDPTSSAQTHPPGFPGGMRLVYTTS